ncbi:MAG: glutamine--fructose-6-phosphate transaminase (isomerizing) [Nitrososphaeraceae archaeon]
MCSIIGYLGNSSAASVLVNSLKRMEYRGYDSVGMATLDNSKICLRKDIGRVPEVDASMNLGLMPGKIGVGHTRWATHGQVTKFNAHPHTDCNNEIVVVHNGIINNYLSLKKKLSKEGHIFKSQTDSEVIAHVVESNLKKYQDIKKVIQETCNLLEGTYAFVVIFKSGIVAGARFDEPLILGLDKTGTFISSDVLGFIEYTDKSIFLDNGDIVILDGHNISIFDYYGNKVNRSIDQVAWEFSDIDKGKYAHYTIKEIHDQNSTISRSIIQKTDILDKFINIIRNSKHVYITGSGSSYHSALLAKYLFYKFPRIRTEIIMSSEFEHIKDFLDGESVIIAISQSGETADVLDCAKIAREKGSKILSIVNISTSSLSRLSDYSLTINCGPEIGVAATKSFTSQISIIYSIIGKLIDQKFEFLGYPNKFEDCVNELLNMGNDIEKIADIIKSTQDIYILGKGIHYPIALEGSLKIKELAYIHAEGIAAGEIKHGPLALVENNTIVIIINPSDETYKDTLNIAHEMKSRGAKLIGISDRNNVLYDYYISIPKFMNMNINPILEIIPLQLLSYYLAIKKNINPDYPRNLAKSVTVK